jgi:hypothetical protein
MRYSDSTIFVISSIILEISSAHFCDFLSHSWYFVSHFLILSNILEISLSHSYRLQPPVESFASPRWGAHEMRRWSSGVPGAVQVDTGMKQWQWEACRIKASTMVCCGCWWDFFLYFGLFNQYSRNEPDQKFFFPNLSLLSHSSPGGMTYVGVTSFALAWLKGLARARLLTGCHIGHSRDIFCRKTELRRLLWRD